MWTFVRASRMKRERKVCEVRQREVKMVMRSLGRRSIDHTSERICSMSSTGSRGAERVLFGSRELLWR